MFRLTPEKEVPTSSGMDYEDQTTRLLNVDVHGTLCKHPLGNMAFVKVAVAGSRQLDMHTALDLPTSYQTSNLVQLPAQAFDITLDAVEPSYPEATSFTQLGYFHRLRKRTQRVDLSDKPEGEGSPTDNAGDPEQSTQGNSEAAIESSVHSAVVFQYHPAPTMDVEFFNGAGTELGDGKIAFQPLTPTMCTHGSAIDVSIAEKKILNGPGQVPGWTLDTGMPIAVAARPLATIKFPQPQEMHATCDWIEGYVSHWSSVGLSRADLHWFKVDAETGELVPKDAATTEYKEFANIVNKTLPLQVKLADLARCAHPEDPKCLVPTTHSTKRTIRTDFSDDDTCSSPQHAGFLNLQTGYKLFDSSADACTEHWARQASARDSKFHAWHLLDWTRDLTSAQRDAWESAGINGDHYARGQEASTSWRQFSKVVLAPAPLWTSLDADVRNNLADELGFTSDTWGRAWAFADRGFLHDVTALPDWNEDLTGAEQVALETLGFNETAWVDSKHGFGNTIMQTLQKDFQRIYDGDYKDGWPSGTAAAKRKILVDIVTDVLKISPWHWMRATNAAVYGERVPGCFWDRGRGEASTSAWVSNSNGVPKPDDADRRHSQRREVSNHPFVLMCPAGQESQHISSSKEGIPVCTACPDGTFKSSEMSLSARCQEKLKLANCPEQHFLHRGPSSTRDDNICVPDGQCAQGYEKTDPSQDACTVCPEGQFKAAVSDGRCTDKKSAKNPPACTLGQYTVLGNSPDIDDTLCITCPFGTLSVAGNVSTCQMKTMIAECESGTYLKLGASATEDDNSCERCPTGSWKAGNAATTTPCTKKSATTCPPGEYLFVGKSVEADDNRCIPCPAGTFSRTTSSAAVCNAKSMAACQAGKYLHLGESKTEDDNICVKPGSCPAGYQTGADLADEGTCVRCAAGTYAPDITSGDAKCQQKRVTECPLGTHVWHGSSIVTDDSRCKSCPAGTFKGEMHLNTSIACFIKRTLPETCPRGLHVSRGLSKTLDDHECQTCRAGSFQDADNASVTECKLKAMPKGGCPAGKYLSLGSSAVKDDYECLDCVGGTFKSASASPEATSCSAKTTKEQCVGTEVLIPSDSPAHDDVCAVPARCNPGERVAKDKVHCEPCPEDEFNPFQTISQTCIKKENPPKGCGVGTYFSHGSDSIRDDWRCIECPPGTYSDSLDVEPSECAEKEMVRCQPGEEVYWGSKQDVNDWFCVVAARYTALCTKSQQVGAQSVMKNLAAGMPSQVAPFTTRYQASITVVGYPPVLAEEVIVVTGSRYVSDAEKVPFPEGRPLLVLHDPPGGSSFSSFINTRATTTVRDVSSNKDERHALQFAMDIGAAGETKTDVVASASPVVIPFGPLVIIGSVTEDPSSVTKYEFSGGKKLGGGFETFDSRFQRHASDVDGGAFTFTYQTSASPKYAGPPSDAFLMPALTFEVIEVWLVKFAANMTSNECKIRGFTDKSLKARNDLSAFYFITANDVETRTLPLLKHVSNDVKNRLGCAEGKGCCTKEEAEVFCDASNLEDYCKWKYEPWELDRTGGYERCISIAEDHWKTKCAAAAKQKARVDHRNRYRYQDGHQSTAGIVWSDCARSRPTCPDHFRSVGVPIQCDREVEESLSEPNLDELIAMGEHIKKKKQMEAFRVQIDEVYAKAVGCLADPSGCPAVDSSFKVQCIPVVGEHAPLGECSRYVQAKGGMIWANSVEEYCSKVHAGTNDEDAELACKTFTPTDQYAGAHDDWYNSLSRNYAKQEKADVGPDVPISYSIVDSLNTGPEPVPSEEPVKLAPMTTLAPVMLIENAMDQSGDIQSKKKQDSFKAYNTLSFEGGGSSIAYTWDTGETANGNNFNGYADEYEIADHRGMSSNSEKGAYGRFAGASFELEGGLVTTQSYEKLAVSTTIDTKSDGASAAFHLADPDAGDYFVVSVWEDPEYPTAILSIQGGASSCKWEYNTYHRAAPAMSVDYTGPKFLPPTAPALFKLRLENAVQYYENGPSTGKSRPGWTEVAKGYSLPALSLGVRPETIKYGLALWINGRAFTGDADIIFPKFGKGATDVVVAVHAGPTGQEPASLDKWRAYPAPLLTFGERCIKDYVALDIGERAVDVALGMAGVSDKREVRFLQSCPAVEWSGDIKAESTFLIDADDSSAVEFVVANPSGVNWVHVPVFERLVFEFRHINSENQASPWITDESATSSLNPAASEGDAYVVGRWTGPTMANFPDGLYNIRVTSMCSNDAPLDEYSQSSSAMLRGVVDRRPPRVLSAMPLSGGLVLIQGGLLTMTFDENIVCAGVYRSGTMLQPEIILAITNNEGRVATLSVSKNHLKYACHDATVSIALDTGGTAEISRQFKDSSSIDAATFKLTVESGIVDVAGNTAVGELLLDGSSSGDRGQGGHGTSNLEGKISEKPADVGNDGSDEEGDGSSNPAGTDGNVGGNDSNDDSPAGEDVGNGSSSSSNGALPDLTSSDWQALAAGGGGSSATKSSYVSMVLIILVLVGAFVYNRRAFADLSAKLDVYRESGNQTMMLPEQTYAAGSTGGEVEKPAGVDETEFPAAINARHATSLTAIASAGSVDVNRSIPNPIYNTVGSRKNTRLLSVDTGLFEANAESVDYLSVDGQPDGTNDHSDNELEI